MAAQVAPPAGAGVHTEQKPTVFSRWFKRKPVPAETSEPSPPPEATWAQPPLELQHNDGQDGVFRSGPAAAGAAPGAPVQAQQTGFVDAGAQPGQQLSNSIAVSLPAGPAGSDLLEPAPGTMTYDPLQDFKSTKKMIERATEFISLVPPPVEGVPPLQKPICIPKVSAGSSMPFARAWPPSLLAHGLPPHLFLPLVDNLNTINFPPVYCVALEMVALAVEFIPYDGSEGMAAAIGLIAELIESLIARRRRKRYFDAVNEQLLHPRGLHMRYVRKKELRRVLALDKKDPMVRPLDEAELRRGKDARKAIYKRDCQERMIERLCSDNPPPPPGHHHHPPWSQDIVAGTGNGTSHHHHPPGHGHDAAAWDGCPAAGLVLDGPGFTPAWQKLDVVQRINAFQVRRNVRRQNRYAADSRKRAWNRLKKGKFLREGGTERHRTTWLSWIVISTVADWESEQAYREAAREARRRQRRARGVMFWRKWQRGDPELGYGKRVITEEEKRAKEDKKAQKKRRKELEKENVARVKRERKEEKRRLKEEKAHSHKLAQTDGIVPEA